ncbi:hypothetical protein Hsero_1613 [Herbaspirillum seropedicae SmR1]|uniref:Uncharacterized protein n=1 Tax=Herbaspirillum seropedicae (strain SmR1) TaxID=757424 RepID=D8IQ80_HERSS|nr:hypothetical protein Hsero_1613 [Herbaspirillum seropedicae SmR1]
MDAVLVSCWGRGGVWMRRCSSRTAGFLEYKGKPRPADFA